MELPTNDCLPFLDVNIHVDDNSINTSIFRKATFSGLGTSFFSNVPTLYKLNAVRTLIHRAYHLCSTFSLFCTELEYLRAFFSNNGYPDKLFDKICKKFLNNIYHPPSRIPSVPKKQIYFSLPYYCKFSDVAAKKLQTKLSRFYTHLDIRFSLKNSFTISSLFPFKDKLPSELHSNIVYKFICRSCNATYIGCTRQKSKVRFHQHLGTSHRTNRQLSSPMHSLPRKHAEDNNHPCSLKDFNIIDYSNNSGDLTLLESLHIYKDKPNINAKVDFSNLYIVK